MSWGIEGEARSPAISVGSTVQRGLSTDAPQMICRREKPIDDLADWTFSPMKTGGPQGLSLIHI